GLEDAGDTGADCTRSRQQGRILRGGAGQCQSSGGRDRIASQRLHDLTDICARGLHAHYPSPTLSFAPTSYLRSTTSSRWIISSRPRKPRMLSISDDFLPMIF